MPLALVKSVSNLDQLLLLKASARHLLINDNVPFVIYNVLLIFCNFVGMCL